MKEQLISFETAKLAKEKGFDLEICNSGWHGDFGELEVDNYPFLGTYSYYTSIYCNNKDEHQFQRPTQSLLQKWLREVHNVAIIVSFNDNNAFEFYYFIHNDISKPYSNRICSLPVKFNSYEKALEIGLQEALKLLPDGKKN